MFHRSETGAFIPFRQSIEFVLPWKTCGLPHTDRLMPRPRQQGLSWSPLSANSYVHDGNLKHIWVTNRDDNSVSVINAASNQLVQRVAVGSAPGGLMVYESSALAGGHH